LLKDLFTIISETPTTVTVRFTSEDHPIFQAHFPNYPILPGFLQIDVILNILDIEIKGIKYAKFIDHISPNDLVRYELKNKDGFSIVKIFKDTKKISEIKYEIK